MLKMSNLFKDRSKKSVFVGVASIPTRAATLELVVDSLLPQVDELGVYLNGYESIPAFLKHPKIRVAQSQKHGDVRDNGKFFFLDKTNAVYYATVDDDINYPENYISRLLEIQVQLGGTNAVGVHGSVYPNPVKKLLTNRHLWHFSKVSKSLNPVDMIGTGTLLFNQRYWKLKYSEFGKPGMADVWFAVAAAKRGFGLWSIPREENWMHPLEIEEEANLFKEGKFDDSTQVSALVESEIGSTRESLLERLVRSAVASADLSLEGASEMAYAAKSIGLGALQLDRTKLYSGALLAHKRESASKPAFSEDLELNDYVGYLLGIIAGAHRTEYANFETSYLKFLDSSPIESLANYQLADMAYLREKFEG